jgi:hypothetical protein
MTTAHLALTFWRLYQVRRDMPSAAHGLVAISVLSASLANGFRNSRICSDGPGATSATCRSVEYALSGFPGIRRSLAAGSAGLTACAIPASASFPVPALALPLAGFPDSRSGDRWLGFVALLSGMPSDLEAAQSIGPSRCFSPQVLHLECSMWHSMTQHGTDASYLLRSALAFSPHHISPIVLHLALDVIQNG